MRAPRAMAVLGVFALAHCMLTFIRDLTPTMAPTPLSLAVFAIKSIAIHADGTCATTVFALFFVVITVRAGAQAALGMPGKSAIIKAHFDFV